MIPIIHNWTYGFKIALLVVRFKIMAGYKNNIESFHSVSSPKNQSKSQRMNEVDVFV